MLLRCMSTKTEQGLPCPFPPPHDSRGSQSESRDGVCVVRVSSQAWTSTLQHEKEMNWELVQANVAEVSYYNRLDCIMINTDVQRNHTNSFPVLLLPLDSDGITMQLFLCVAISQNTNSITSPLLHLPQYSQRTVDYESGSPIRQGRTEN